MRYVGGSRTLQVSSNVPFVDWAATSSAESLDAIVAHFEEELARLEPFHQLQSAIDSTFIVLEKPDERHRILFLGRGTRLELALDPRNLAASSALVLPRGDVLTCPESCSLILDWLNGVLGVPTTDTAEQFECKICCSFFLEDAFPAVVCESPSCDASYHADCVRRWFEVEGSASRAFGVVRGQCLCCGAVMTLAADAG